MHARTLTSVCKSGKASELGLHAHDKAVALVTADTDNTNLYCASCSYAGCHTLDYITHEVRVQDTEENSTRRSQLSYAGLLMRLHSPEVASFIGSDRRLRVSCMYCIWRSNTSSTCSRSDGGPGSSPPCSHDRSTSICSLRTPDDPSDTRCNQQHAQLSSICILELTTCVTWEKARRQLKSGSV